MLPTRTIELLSYRFFEAASDAVIIIDASGIVIHLNTQTEKVFSYRRDELLNQPIEILIPERLRVRHVVHLRSYFRNPLPQAMGSGFTAVGLRKDGTEFPIDIALSPLPTESGFFVASAIRDMTPQRWLEDDLRQRMHDLEEVDRQKDQFLTTLSHEINSPLAAAAYSAELLRQPDIADDVRVEAARIVLEEIYLMRRLLEDLSELPRVKHGNLTVHKAATDFVEIVRLGVEISRPLIERCRHALEITLPPTPLRTQVDATRLVQVVVNLLNNAARYTPEGGLICLSIEQDKSEAVLRVKDNGIGIQKEMLTRVFEMFARLDGAKHKYADGMGIGLAFVRQVMEIHGGSVEAVSDGGGQGSEFVVRLPLT